VAEYYISRKGPKTIAIAKFPEGAAQPSEVYHVTETVKPQCDCPAWVKGFKRPCKHWQMVLEFKSAGEPNPYMIER
jgi:hypothetical protein